MYIGIDFGACYSKIAVFSDDTELEGFVSQCGEEGIPTKYLCLDGVYYFGRQCEDDLARDHSELILKEFKTDARANINGSDEKTQYKYKDVIFNYIKYLKKTIDDAIASNGMVGACYDAITITAPAGRISDKDTVSSYNRFLKKTVSELFEISSEKVYVREEPVAAALSYFYKIRDNDEDCVVLIFDLGGSTLDLSVVERRGKDYYTRAIGGNNYGSNCWDLKLKESVLSQLELNEESLSSKEQFKFDVELKKLKHKLSKEEAAKIRNVVEGKSPKQVKIKRDEFEECTHSLLEKSMDLLKDLVDHLILGPQSVDRVVLVGGGSKMPQIGNSIIQRYPEWSGKLVMHENMSTAVSIGAAYHSYLADSKGVHSDFKYVGILAHSYGMVVRKLYSGEYMVHYVLFKGKEFNGDSLKATLDPMCPSSDNSIDMIFSLIESDLMEQDCGSDHLVPLEKDGNNSIIEFTLNIPKEFLGKATRYVVTPMIEVTDDNLVNLLIDGKSVESYRNNGVWRT